MLQSGLKRSTALLYDLADGKTTYCQFAEADKALTDSIVAEAGPLQAELIKIAAVPEFVYPAGIGGGPGR